MAIPVKSTPTQMSLAQELASIDNQNRITQIQQGSAPTIDVFWRDFIEPSLPDKGAIIKWFKLLNDYVDQDDAVFALRCYGNWESYKIKDDYTLRRGFYNLTDDDYSFFYTDNFFAAYFAKMAVDNYVPTLSEFNAMMKSREFPARFGRSAAVERSKAAYSIDGRKGKNPGFTTNGYKIAHIVDSGKRIFSDGLETTIGQICDRYCVRGNYNDWTPHNDSFGDFYARDLAIDPSAKAFLIAHFLRFVCPMNYIFTPGKNHHVLGVKVRMNDIAESEEIQQYAMLKFHERFGTVYEDYLSRLLLPPAFELSNLPSINHLANKVINIQYGKNIKKTTPKNSTSVSSKSLTPKTTSSSKINPRSILSMLKSKQLAKTLPSPKTITQTDRDMFESYLKKCCPAIKTEVSRNEYLYSLETAKFNKLLTNHNQKHNQKHNQNIDVYNCNNINILIDVLDDLVNKEGSTDIDDALSVGNKACRSALCYFLKHLLSVNGITI